MRRAVSTVVLRIAPKLRSLELRRLTNYNATPSPLLPALLAEVALESVRRLKCAEDMVPLWENTLFHRWQSLQVRCAAHGLPHCATCGPPARTSLGPALNAALQAVRSLRG